METVDEKTLEIAQRTRENLKYMDDLHDQKEPIYEFTQLFNSMLGMLICVREKYYKDQVVSWRILQDNHLLDATSTLKNKASSFGDLVTYVRNALAHSQYDFVVNKGEITGIRVWNLIDINTADIPENRKPKKKFTEEELRELADVAVKFVEWKLDKKIGGAPPKSSSHLTK